MDPKSVALLLAVLLLLPAGTRGQDPDIEIWILKNCDDEPLSEAIELIAALGQMKIVIDPELRDSKITIMLDHEVNDALRAVVKAARAHLWKLDDGSYRISAKPQPGTADKAGDKPVKEVAEPAWKKDLARRLSETEVEVDFQGDSIQSVLEGFAKASKVSILLDPHVPTVRKPKDLEVHVFTDPKRGPLSAALTSVALSVKLGSDLRWGGVFVSTFERLEALPLTCLPEASEKEVPEAEAKTRKTLAEKKITLRLKRATVVKALGRIAKLGGAKIAWDAKDLKKLARVTIDVKDMTVEHVLSLVLIPRGRKLTFAEKGLTVAPAD